jgi:hypothetical protein
MPTFLLIDHSVQDTTGHHYEYAVRVLDAAEKAGYTPVLGANAHFQPRGPIPFKVYAVYPDGFWPRMARARSSIWVVKAIGELTGFIRRTRSRLFFSRLGFLWLIRNEPLGYLKWHPFDSPVGGALLVFTGIPALCVRLFVALLAPLVPFRAYFANAAGSIWTLFRSLFARLADFLLPAGSMAHWRFARRKERSFGAATLQILRSVQPGQDDIIFIPTLAEPEMLGLLRCFGKYSPSRLPGYHLLFRRNLYAGREPEFERQEEALLPVRNAFLHFRSALSGHRVFFYTDTDELSCQFNRLRIFPFRTCPIPHTAPASEHEPVLEPLRITYLGDARGEKGYQHLPGVVQDLWRSEAQPGKVSFVLQSNYNVYPGEPDAVVARSQLSAFPAGKVQLITESCTSEEYRRTLMSAAVMLLPYRAEEYYSRSSGVLIEALAAGIPVVVPATSWLAKQIADPAYRYLASLAESAGAVLPRRHYWVRENTGRNDMPYTPASLTFGGEQSKVHTWVTVPKGASYILIAIRFDNRPGDFVTCYVDQLDQGGRRLGFTKEMLGSGYSEKTARVALPIHPKAQRIWVSFRNSFHDTAITIHDPDIRFLSCAATVAISAVGVAFSEESPQAISAALREVLAHYPHYRQTAISHSEAVYEFHNAANLVRVLAASSCLAAGVEQ